MSSKRFRERLLSGNQVASDRAQPGSSQLNAPGSGPMPSVADETTSSERSGERLPYTERPAANGAQAASTWGGTTVSAGLTGSDVVDDMSSDGFRERLRAVERRAPGGASQFGPISAEIPAPVFSPPATPLRAAYSEVALPRSARWQPQNWRLRTKLTALTVIPLLLALVLAALRMPTRPGGPTPPRCASRWSSARSDCWH